MTENTAYDSAVYCTEELLTAVGLHSQLICLSVLNIILAIAAIVGNTLILIALQKETSLHPPSKVLFRSLASTDLCVGMIQTLYAVYWLAVVHKRWQICHYIFVLQSVSGTILIGVSLTTITAISVDRLLALLLGVGYRQVVTLKRMYLAAVVFWIYPIVGVGIGFYSRGAWIIYASVSILVCMITTICCYTRIFLRLRHHQTQVLSNTQEQANRTISLNIARYRKSVSSSMWVQLTLLFCYLPYMIVAPFAYPAIRSRLPSPFYVVLHALVTLLLANSSLNPIVYCWKIKEVRRAVKDTLTQLLFSQN